MTSVCAIRGVGITRAHACVTMPTSENPIVIAAAGEQRRAARLPGVRNGGRERPGPAAPSTRCRIGELAVREFVIGTTGRLDPAIVLNVLRTNLVNVRFRDAIVAAI